MRLTPDLLVPFVTSYLEVHGKRGHPFPRSSSSTVTRRDTAAAGHLEDLRVPGAIGPLTSRRAHLSNYTRVAATRTPQAIILHQVVPAIGPWSNTVSVSSVCQWRLCSGSGFG